MKVTIDVEGQMLIQAETEIEAYAIRKFSEENMNHECPNITLQWGPIFKAPCIYPTPDVTFPNINT